MSGGLDQDLSGHFTAGNSRLDFGMKAELLRQFLFDGNACTSE